MTTTESEPMGLFLYGIKSPITKDRYLKRLEHFFNFLELSGTMDEKAVLLISQIKQHEPLIVYLMPPLQQFNSGTPIDEIQCKEELELILR